MLTHRVAAAFLAAGLCACEAPASPMAEHVATWCTTPDPARAVTCLDIQTAVDVLQGTGIDYGPGGRRLASFMVAGVTHGGPIRFTMTYPDQTIATFDVQSLDARHMIGQWQLGTQAPYQRTFLRK